MPLPQHIRRFRALGFLESYFQSSSGSRIPDERRSLCPHACRTWWVSALFFLLAASDLLGVVTLEVGKSNGAVPFPHSNGRQIGRNRVGIWFVAYDGGTGGAGSISLSASRSDDPEFAGDFYPPLVVVGKSPEARISTMGGAALGGSFVIDDNDTLHLIWQSSEPKGIWYVRCSVEGAQAAQRIGQSGSWSAPQRVDDSGRDPRMGDLSVDPEGRLWVTYSQASASGDGNSLLQAGGKEYKRHQGRKEEDEIWAATPSDQGWRRKRLTLPGAFRAPVMDLDPGGTLHLAFTRDDSWFLFYLQIPEFALGFDRDQDFTQILPHGPWSGTGYLNYSVVGWEEKALVVFEKSEHVILYAYFDGQDWTRKPLHFSQEKLHRPQLARDEHGVAWVFWNNSARGHTFYSRWLGSRFSAPYESRTLYGDPFSHEEGVVTLPNRPTTGPRLSDFHSVQKEMSSGSGYLGMAVSSTGPSGGVFFDRMRVPDLKPERGRKVLFLDMLEISATEGLVESFHPMRKHPSNPILRTGPPGSFDDLRAHAYGEVLFDEGKFRMWYSGLDQAFAVTQRSNHHVGYAESEDGLNWVKPTLNQVEYRGSKANNIVDLDYQGGGAYMPMIVKDEREANPDHRYKAIVAQRGNTLHYSADGVHWATGGSVKGGFGDRRNFFYDILEPKPERRWKVFSHCGIETYRWVRATCVYWSSDLLEWTSDPRNPNMLPRAGIEVEQHLTSAWPYANMYLGMFDIWGPNQLMPQQLIASRDGVNFVHVFDGEPVIELGKQGEWDAGWVSPVNVPLEIGDETWFYYSGSASTIGPFVQWNSTPMMTGLATIRRDGFVSLNVHGDSESGWATTIPFQPSGRPLQLEINAEGLSQGEGRILVELREDGRVLGRSSAVIDDGVELPVLWPGGARQLALPSGGRPLRLRFRLEGKAQLYSFTFK